MSDKINILRKWSHAISYQNSKKKLRVNKIVKFIPLFSSSVFCEVCRMTNLYVP